MTDGLSRLTPVPVRTVWEHEARDFTEWLLANADVLSEVLGVQLELTAAEHRVGGFALDLIGTDPSTGGVVIVENQLEPTDHGHLGQLLTYAGGTSPTTVVWCSPRFRDEHRAALDWLNERTDEDTRFFGVEIAVVRIDDSKPAPLFRVVAQPNDWTKRVHTEKSASLSGKSEAYRNFWGALLERIRVEHPEWTKSTKPSAQSWMTLPYGTSHAWYTVLFTQAGPAVELYFGGPDAATNTAEYEKVLAHRDVLESMFGEPLLFEALEGKKACRIRSIRPDGGDVLNAQDHEAFADWFMEAMTRFRAATQHVRTLVTLNSTPPGNGG